MFSKLILIANGAVNSGHFVDTVVAAAQSGVPVWAVDGGAEHAVRLGLSLQLILGDMDSVQPDTLVQLEARGAEVLRYPVDKDQTDLELGLHEAARRGANWIRVLGATGSRLDQTYGNLQLLRHAAFHSIDLKLVASDQTLWVAHPGDHILSGSLSDIISLLPLSQTVTSITTRDLAYPLNNEPLSVDMLRGMSNRICGPNPHISFAQGQLLIIHSHNQ